MTSTHTDAGNRVGLPSAVARYLRFALSSERRVIRTARFRQSGVMRASEHAAWRSFTAVETISTDPIGFTWDAWMRLGALLAVRIRDSYADGEGRSEAKLAGLVTVAKRRGTTEMASASLMRYAAEAPWFPTALLPREHVGWAALGEKAARMTLQDGVTTVQLTVEFGDYGEIVRTSTARYRDIGNELVLTPWAGHFRDYARIDGMMIPTAGEVEWIPPTGPVSVWRGRIDDARYVFA